MARKSKKKEDLQLPHDSEAEKNILTHIFLDESNYYKVINFLGSEDFFVPQYRLIFNTMAELKDKNQPIQLATVRDLLIKKDEFKEIGDDVLSQMVSLEIFEPLEVYINIVKEKSIFRQIIKKSNEIALDAYEQKDLSQITDKIFKNFNDVSRFTINNVKKEGNLGTKLLEFKENVISKIIDGTYKPNYTPTNYSHLDKKLGGGLLPGSFVIIGARASVGKTTFALNIMKNIALAGKKILFFSLEQPYEQILARYLSMTLEIPFSAIMGNNLQPLIDKFPGEDPAKLLNTAMDTVFKYAENIFIVDDSKLTIDDIKNLTREYRQEHNIDIVVVDYLQFVKLPKLMETRLREITLISGSLKEIARETNVSLIALSQLSRSIEQRKQKERAPKLSDLRDSGALEQDADIVMFLWTDEEDAKNKDDIDMYISIEKNRNGETGRVKFHFSKPIFTFNEQN